MPTMTYICKKNGKTYVYKTVTELTDVRDSYAWHKGAREYADNYHASVTLTGKNAFKGTKEEFTAEIDKLCDEALRRWNLGDLPGHRTEIDIEAAAAAKYGMTVDQFKALMAASKSAAETVVETAPKGKKAA